MNQPRQLQQEIEELEELVCCARRQIEEEDDQRAVMAERMFIRCIEIRKEKLNHYQ